jgi:hypothetical protein
MEWLKEWLWWFVTKITQFWYDLGEGLIETMMGLFPDAWAESSIAVGFGNYWTTANAWLPMNEALGLYTALTAFQVSVITLRWVLKMIPGLGG